MTENEDLHVHKIEYWMASNNLNNDLTSKNRQCRIIPRKLKIPSKELRKVQLFSFIIFTCEHSNNLHACKMHWLTHSYLFVLWIFSISCKREMPCTSQPAIQNISSAIHLFDLICSKIFLSHSSVQLHPLKIFVSYVSIWMHPFKYIYHLFIHLAWLSVSHPFPCHAFVRKEHFRMRGHILLIVLEPNSFLPEIFLWNKI